MHLGCCVAIISISNRDTICKATEVFNGTDVSDNKVAIKLHPVCSHTHSYYAVFVTVA